MELNEREHEVPPEMALEEALESNPNQDPTRYLATLMPSRMALRSNQGLTLTRKCLSQLQQSHYLPSNHISPLRLGRRFLGDVTDASNANLIHMNSFTQGLTTNEYDMDQMLDYIQNMTAPIEVKRQYYRALRDQPRFKDTCAKSLSQRSKLIGRKMKNDLCAIFSYVALWRHSLHHIEGHYGIGLVTVFRFIKMLLLLNLVASLFIILLVIVPHKLTSNNQPPDSLTNSTNECVANYTNSINWRESSNLLYVQDLIQGTGWMELCEMFYGFYRSVVTVDGRVRYNLPLAYLLVIMCYFLASLLIIVLSAAHQSRKSLFLTRGRFYESFSAAFTSWDFCIRDVRKARVRHDNVYNEATYIISESLRRQARRCRTDAQAFGLFLVRFSINLLVVAILAACAASIYFVTNYAFKMVNTSDDRSLTLTYEYLPSVTITSLNVVVPLVFTYLVRFEKYSQDVVVGISLVRMVFLRLSSLGVLLASVYHLVNCDQTDQCGKGMEQCKNPVCWETYAGQQLYKLTLLDLLVAIANTFLVELPRKLLYDHSKLRLIVWLGPVEFDIPRHILDIVYAQAICWLGTFYAPLLAAITVAKYFMLFYLKKFSLFVTSVPASKPFRASKSSKFFTVALLSAYLIAVVPVSIAIANVHPSISCGPFHSYNTYWDVVVDAINSCPLFIRKIVEFLITPGFTLPTFLALVLAIYYFNIKAAANKHALELLEDQLVVLGRDKQILMKQIHRVTGTLRASRRDFNGPARSR